MESPDTLVGTTVAGRYRVGALIDRGGTCAVYRADDEKQGQLVAIKVLPAALAAQPDLARRFQREITSARRIDHPNVIQIRDSGSLADGALYMVMELLDGKSLRKVMAGGKLEIARALGIARQILVPLERAHGMGIVHRDVKPDNVMIVDGDVAKLFDFGIASNDRAAEKLTAAGVAFGTPEYISPEMAMGLAVDGRADVYAVGVMLFELVSGKLPFRATEPAALLRAHLSEPAPPLRSVAPDAPAELEALILRAMQKTPEGRFASAQEMIGAVDQILGAILAKKTDSKESKTGAANNAAKSRLPLLVGGALAVIALAGAGWWWLAGSENAPLPETGPIPRHVRMLEAGRTCGERKLALMQLLDRQDPTLLPILKRARDRGAANNCMMRELHNAIRSLEPPPPGSQPAAPGIQPR